MRGDGRIFQKKGSLFWHMAYYVDGREVSESTKEVDEERARRGLRLRAPRLPLAGQASAHLQGAARRQPRRPADSGMVAAVARG